MALRLQDLIISGELINKENYSTHGWLRLRGHEQTLLLQLTGNCHPDLAGKHIRFEAPDAAEREESDALVEFDFDGLAWQQVGPTGEMTADRMVKVTDCPVEEMYRRSKLGEPPPFEWKRCLYLEWFSQNGRVVVELVDPVIEFVDGDEDEIGDIDDASLSGEGDSGSAVGTDASEAGVPADNEDADEDLTAELDSDEDFDAANEDDPYGLFSPELQQQFDEEALHLDSAIEGEETKPRSIREM